MGRAGCSWVATSPLLAAKVAAHVVEGKQKTPRLERSVERSASADITAIATACEEHIERTRSLDVTALQGQSQVESSPANLCERTISLDVAALTGKPQVVARAALDVVGEDCERAYKLLMSEMEVTAIDDEPHCEVEALQVGAHAWLGEEEDRVSSVGTFKGFTLLRLPRSFRGSLRLFSLEPLEVCVFSASTDAVAPGWAALPVAEAPAVDGRDGPGSLVQHRTFNPGLISVPLEDAQMPLFRTIQARGSKRCRSRALSVGSSFVEEAADNDRAGRATTTAPAPSEAAEGQGRRPLPEFRVLREIGAGAFGEVYLAEEAADGKPLAVKRCRVQASEGHGYRREFELLGRISHPCIVGLVGFSEEAGKARGEKQVQIVMEYLPENLHARMAGSALSPPDVRLFAFQLLRALAHLQALRIVHRDVKPENVLVDAWRLKLADFGSAKELGEGPSQSYICSRWWRAPELVLGASEYTMSVDWWSCGCVIGEMMQGQPLFRGATNGGQIYAIIEVLGTPSAKEVEALSPSTQEGCGSRMKKNLNKLAGLRRPGRSWQEVLPDFAAHSPEAIQLLPPLLSYDPSSRRPPAELLLSQPLAALAEEAPPSLFSFSNGELDAYPPRVRRGLLAMSGNAKRRAQRQQCSEASASSAKDADIPAGRATPAEAKSKRPRTAAERPVPSPVRASPLLAATPRSDEL